MGDSVQSLSKNRFQQTPDPLTKMLVSSFCGILRPKSKMAVNGVAGWTPSVPSVIFYRENGNRPIVTPPHLNGGNYCFNY